MNLVEAKNVSKSYKKLFSKEKFLALQNVSFKLQKGKTLGIVGESGSGKSTLARLILKLEKPDSGSVISGSAQAVFQEPFASLDPRFTVREILREPFLVGNKKRKNISDSELENLLKEVGLGAHYLKRRPSQLSGGECQRVAIARALGPHPDLIVCDEAVSSLDALVQAQILNLFLKMQKEKGVSYIFISHDIRVVRHMSDEILVLKDGSVCEYGSAKNVLESPQHAYTKLLLRNSFLAK